MALTRRLQDDWAKQDAERLAQLNADLPTVYTVQLSEAELLDLASGFLPLTVTALARAALAWMDEDRRAAEAAPRPRLKTTKRKHSSARTTTGAP